MKNPNQIRKNDSRGIPPSQEPKLRTTRTVGAGIAANLQPGWNEVAMIDFTGYTDHDCEERIIYKTPDGKLKAARHSTGQVEVIEDVTRDQVTRWLAQCVIPEEFEKDFAPQCKAPEKRRVKLRLSKEGKAVIESAAAKRGLTISQFAEKAVRAELRRRPAKAGKGNPDRRLLNRFTPEERRALKQAAESLGLTLAEFWKRSARMRVHTLTKEEIASVLEKAAPAQLRAFNNLVASFLHANEVRKGGAK